MYKIIYCTIASGVVWKHIFDPYSQLNTCCQDCHQEESADTRVRSPLFQGEPGPFTKSTNLFHGGVGQMPQMRFRHGMVVRKEAVERRVSETPTDPVQRSDKVHGSVIILAALITLPPPAQQLLSHPPAINFIVAWLPAYFPHIPPAHQIHFSFAPLIK